METTTRWPKLRGETTEWDYVILIGDPHTMENFPGHYAHGVQMIAQEVAKEKGLNVVITKNDTLFSYESAVDITDEVAKRMRKTAGTRTAQQPAASSQKR